MDIKGIKFITRRPRISVDSDEVTQTLTVHVTPMDIYFRIQAGNEEGMRTAKAELKLALVDAILKGEWEIED